MKFHTTTQSLLLTITSTPKLLTSSTSTKQAFICFATACWVSKTKTLRYLDALSSQCRHVQEEDGGSVGLLGSMRRYRSCPLSSRSSGSMVPYHRNSPGLTFSKISASIFRKYPSAVISSCRILNSQKECSKHWCTSLSRPTGARDELRSILENVMSGGIL